MAKEDAVSARALNAEVTRMLSNLSNETFPTIWKCDLKVEDGLDDPRAAAVDDLICQELG